jgi:hypothetical protein
MFSPFYSVTRKEICKFTPTRFFHLKIFTEDQCLSLLEGMKKKGSDRGRPSINQIFLSPANCWLAHFLHTILKEELLAQTTRGELKVLKACSGDAFNLFLYILALLSSI